MHKALSGDDAEPIALRNRLVLRELPRRGVEYDDATTSGRQNGALLAAARRQAEDVLAGDLPEPIAGNRLVRSQDNGPVAPTSTVGVFG